MMIDLKQEELRTLVKSFYAKVSQDDLLGPIFNDVAKVDWDHHVGLICQFWSKVMMGVPGYEGNPMLRHFELSQKAKITPAHFERWLQLFEQEARASLPATSAEMIIQRAHMIANALQSRIIMHS